MSRYSIALDEQASLHRWAGGPQAIEYLSGRQGGVPSKDGRFEYVVPPSERLNYLAAVLSGTEGDPFYWSSEMCSLLEQAASGKPSLKLRESDLPSPYGYMWFDKLLEIPERVQGRSESDTDRFTDNIRSCCWATVRVQGERRGIRFIFTTVAPHAKLQWARHGGIPSGALWWPFEDTAEDVLEQTEFPDDIDQTDPRVASANGRYQAALYLMASALLLLQQKVFVARKEQADRATRRRAGVDRPINVIYLRRAANAPARREGETEVEWQFRWFSSAHWRRYRDGKLLDRPIWVSACVKGPENLPLKLSSASRLFNVNR